MNRESKPEKSNPETGKFFVQPEKTMNREPKPEKGNLKIGKFFVQPEKNHEQETETGEK